MTARTSFDTVHQWLTRHQEQFNAQNERLRHLAHATPQDIDRDAERKQIDNWKKITKEVNGHLEVMEKIPDPTKEEK